MIIYYDSGRQYRTKKHGFVLFNLNLAVFQLFLVTTKSNSVEAT